MNELPMAPPSIRERIVTVLIKRFLDQKRGVDGAAITWDVVTDEPLSSDQQSKGYAVGVYDTSERKQDGVQHIMCFLNIVFEFHSTLADGDEPMKIARACLTEVQRVATKDLNTKEEDGYHLTLDIQEKGNELENIAPNPSKVSGVAIFEVKYRHRPNDPTKR